MPRQRPAKRCTARRTNGLPCSAFAIVGGWVCVAHGGRAPQVKAAARQRLLEEGLRRGFDASWRRHEQRLAEWQSDRVLATAALMDVAPECVTPALIGACHALHGRPPLQHEAPQLELDKRYGLRRRHRVGGTGDGGRAADAERGCGVRGFGHLDGFGRGEQ